MTARSRLFLHLAGAVGTLNEMLAGAVGEGHRLAGVLTRTGHCAGFTFLTERDEWASPARTGMH